MPEIPSTSTRLLLCFKDAYSKTVRTCLWLFPLIIPVSFFVLILKLTGILSMIAQIFKPLFALLGLPGESALVFITGALLNLYSCIAVMEALDLGMRTVTILSLMCLISHNLVVEVAVQKKAGSNAWSILFTRLGASIVAALILGFLMPPDATPATTHLAGNLTEVPRDFSVEIKNWLSETFFLSIKIILIVALLMLLQGFLEKFGGLEIISRFLKYPLKIMGIPPEAAFLWVVANTIGLTYGGTILIDHVEQKRISHASADILNHHLAVSHALLEDTCLFVAIGVSVWWITLPRLFIAFFVTWGKQLAHDLGSPSSRSPE